MSELSNEVKNNDLELFAAIKQMIGADPDHVVMMDKPFRPGTRLPVVTYNFVFSGAGIGDWMCYMPAMLWLAKFCPWIRGRIYVAEFFCDFARNVMRDYPDWRVHPAERINDFVEPNSVFRGPSISVGGRSPGFQLLNGTGGHLVDVGFAYFTNQFPPPPGADLFPVLDLSDVPEIALPSRYVVFTTGGVTPVRTVPGKFWNPIIDWVKSKGMTPVFLGKSNMAGCVDVNFPDDCDYSKGINLRDKTSLLEAAKVMRNALCTIGLDNGLLHLAACTDAAIVAGYNIVHPKQRRPNRATGEWREIYLTQDELACANCQTEMKTLPTHTFKQCLYGTKDCLDILFANNGKRWIDAIESILYPP